MNNEEFLNKVKEAFYKYLETGSRSNEKLKILHGSIAADSRARLGADYKVHSLGFGNDKEVGMDGRYMNKKVDIAVEKDGEVIAAIALKFIMRNYSQNSNNYFENMLGETANIRAAGKPYFQVLIIPSKVPYFDNKHKIKKIEVITNHNLEKYIKLSNDNVEDFMHTPNKTLLCLVDIPDIPDTVKTEQEYIEYYKGIDYTVNHSGQEHEFGSSVIYNDYEKFIDKITHYILSI